MAALEGVHAVFMAEQGDMGPLLDRLRASDLSRDEVRFIEARLTGKGGKIKRGRKPSDAIAARNQNIILADAWLRIIRGFGKKHARLVALGQSTGLGESQISDALKTTKTLSTIYSIDQYKRMKMLIVSGVVDVDTMPMPEILDIKGKS